ncbi:hypothetical protein PM10SUCC1_32380 [Propionigenium maris DSM 9537]|uniref:Uncharacterized protein n=1 Tax=Propionigenium maris DSM 9537 TaxID=1123000 RepID=A0A9W6LP81_9FUSO|nr:hypothetical protein [Propionigenium maris]GLI57724.1 hypothetical protein PM10SUCC1_32380 [Propionigenium maris DSM 9537]
MDNETAWRIFFGDLIKNITGIENVLEDGNDLLPEQEKVYPKVRFTLTEVEKSTSKVVTRDRRMPSADPDFKYDIERSYIYTPLWLCSINIADKEENNSLDKVGRAVLNRRRILQYLRTHYKEHENFDFYKNSSFKRAPGTDLSGYTNSQALYHKKLNIEFTFSIIDTDVIATIERVETDYTVKED